MTKVASPTTSTTDTTDTTDTTANNDIPTEEEIQWALSIKRAAEKEATHVNAGKISDLEYLQYGIVTKGQTTKALKRIQRMQAYKKEYGIQLDDGSIEQAKRDLKTFYTVHDGLYLSLAALEDGTHVMSCDYHKACSFQNEGEGVKIRMRGLFYHLQACQPSIAAMRAGYTPLINFDTTTLSDLSVRHQRKVSQAISYAFPIRGRRMVLLNANAIIVAFWQIIKYFLSQKIRDRTVICGNHTEFFQSPSCIYPREVVPREWGGTFDSSRQSMIRVVEGKLEQRYALQAKFRLEKEEMDDEEEK
jgi:hypothetical protein